jgi:RNA polymerase sigma-70 factor (ECF subfamily)
VTPDAEARIAALARQGDAEGASVALIEAYGREVHHYLQAVLPDPGAADEAFSAFQLNVWKGMSSWRQEGSARAWAYRVAWNAASRNHRDPWRRRRVRMVTGLASQLAQPSVSSQRRTEEERTRALAELRACLPPGEQTLLILKVDRGLTWAEVAAALSADGDPPALAALRKRFERLTRKLGRLARARGLLPRDGGR